MGCIIISEVRCPHEALGTVIIGRVVVQLLTWSANIDGRSGIERRFRASRRRLTAAASTVRSGDSHRCSSIDNAQSRLTRVNLHGGLAEWDAVDCSVGLVWQHGREEVGLGVRSVQCVGKQTVHSPCDTSLRDDCGFSLSQVKQLQSSKLSLSKMS